ncbi:hypothetical protein COHA_009388 [Chlorella ohadii]|uniref:Metallo-beta-lactamase domain-containing protein n=1 Tax=Chlorella ohadii TaxID=2649997 RepID=A0AAD5H1J9_9CHLO|nr:hypothetical protein COHA_009388 [Chlorella ohadii]
MEAVAPTGRLGAGQQPARGTQPGWLPGRPSQRPSTGRQTHQSTQCRAGGRRNNRPRIQSDGFEHLGSSQLARNKRPFPGPPPGQGPPLRVLPIGGLGEIGMNCMLIGVYDRYILVDAGLMFPDFTDLGMQKILPDTSFLAQWRDKIEAVVITHGHEDHIGALPWVVPALDPSTPIYAGGFPMQLIKRRLQEFNLYDEGRLHTINMRQPFQLGPFECTPIRVTHSIPDCCGLVLRSDHGTIVHTGDWKIDENPVDGEVFDREMFDSLGREGVSLFMSDSTNVLAPGRTTSESLVETSLVNRVLGHQGKGRVITTQFASNLHRMAAVKKAADASGRKICFIGMSLSHYLEAAQREGRAPFDPKDVIDAADLDDYDPNQLLIVTTGSQAEPRAQLTMAAHGLSHQLKLQASDLVLYSAKVIPGNDTRVMQMMNAISQLGPEIAMGRDENLHTSGHAYKGELEEVLRYVKPQHFLPVHGEYAFLTAHAQLARENGVNYTSVIRNGQMLGVADRRNRNTVSIGSAAGVAGAAEILGRERTDTMQMLGEVDLINYYNDGNKGTGTAAEMGLEERQVLAVEGIVVCAVDVGRHPEMIRAVAEAAAPNAGPAAAAAAARAASQRRLKANVRVTTRGMWVGLSDRLLEQLHAAAKEAVERLPGDAALSAVERVVADSLRRTCKAFNRRRPEVVVIAHEFDPRAGAAAAASARRRDTSSDFGSDLRGYQGGQQQRGGGGWQGQQRGYQGRGQQQQQQKRMSDREARDVLAENDRRRQQRVREADLLSAPKGAELEDLASSADSSDDDQEVLRQLLDGAEKIEPSGGGSGAAPKKRRGRPPKAASAAAGGELQELPPGFLDQRRSANPRDHPEQGGNVEYP